MDLAGKKNNTLVEIWNNSAADQDGDALLMSAADKTDLQSLIQDYITIDQAVLGLERRKIVQSCTVAMDNKYINAESSTAI